jgi:hypothetical protein
MIRTISVLFSILVLSFSVSAQIQKEGAPRLMSKKQILSEPVPTYTLPEFEVNDVQKDSLLRHHKKLKFARMFDLSVNITEEAKAIPQEDGTLYVLSVRSKGAYSLSLVFKPYQLPDKSELYVYSPDFSHVKGAFTSKNNKSSGSLAIAPVRGQEVIIEYFVPENYNSENSLKLTKVGHDYLDIYGFLRKKSSGIGESGDCNVNINCPEGQDFQDVKHAVCQVVFNGYLCTGTLVNTTKYSGAPYFLTANHCIDSEADAQDAVFYFNFESPECDTSYIDDYSTISASSLVATAPDEKLDFSLLKMSETIPIDYKPYYAGWNLDTAGIENATTIHHPSGDVKKITRDYDPPVSGNYGGTYDEDSHWWIKEWEMGTTEGGSSGAPLFDQDKRIIGNLTGGEASCDYNYNDFFAKVSRSWDDFGSAQYQLEKWLDPNDTRFNKINNYYPYQDKPSNLRAIYDSLDVSLIWNPVVDNSNIEYYEVFRNDSLINTTQQTSFIDNSVINDSLFFYKIRGYNKTGSYTAFSDSVGVLVSKVYNLPFNEPFESLDSLSAGWFDYIIEGSSSWKIEAGGYQNVPDTSSEGSANAYFHGADAAKARLVSPNMNMNDLDYVNLTFDLSIPEIQGKVDRLELYIRYSDSLPWHLFKTYEEKIESWQKVKIHLPIPSDDYHIAFEATSNGGGGVYLDDMEVRRDTNAVSAPPIKVSTQTICSGDSVVFSLDTADVYENYSWNFGYGAKPQSATGYGPHKVLYDYKGNKELELTLNSDYKNYYSNILLVHETPTPAISYGDSVLRSNYSEGNQWYFNGEPISGADSTALNINEDGTYLLEVTNNYGCAGYSDSLEITGLGFTESRQNSKFTLYPNPVEDIVILRFLKDNEEANYSITNLQGQVVKKGIIEDTSSESIISVRNLSQGIYFITIQPVAKLPVRRKFIKL